MNSFTVEGLNVTASSMEVLNHIERNIPTRMPKTVNRCNGLLDRLKLVHDPIAALELKDKSQVEYNRILVRFLRLQIRRPVLVRLAKSDTTLLVLQELHHRLDHIFTKLGLADISGWEAGWDPGCAKQLEELKKLASRSPFMLANEVGGDKRLREAIMKLRGAVSLNQGGGELQELRRTVLDQVSSCKGLMSLKIYNWFIAIEDVSSNT